MTPAASPSWTEKSTWFTAVRPPNRLVRPRVAISSAMRPPLSDSGDTPAGPGRSAWRGLGCPQNHQRLTDTYLVTQLLRARGGAVVRRAARDLHVVEHGIGAVLRALARAAVEEVPVSYT